jgi:starvation-inducible DNA-binding protein
MNYIGLPNKDLIKISEKLNTLLATYSVYYQNLRSFHWHIRGNNFYEIHRLFEDLYNDAKVKIDDIAERILTINQKPLGSMADYIEKSKIKESKDIMMDEKMASTILQNHKELIKIIRNVIKQADEIGDEGTIDLMGGFLFFLEKKSWMLNAWKGRRKAGFY